MNTSLRRRSAYSFYSLILVAISNFAFNHIGYSQPEPFVPATEDVALLKDLSVKYEKLYRQELSSISSKSKKDYEEVYKLRWNNVQEQDS